MRIDKEKLKQSIPVEDYYISMRGEPKRRNPNKNTLTYSCCFHNDGDAPNLTIFIDNGGYFCNSCGASGGDVIEFHKQHEKIDFKTACKQLADKYNSDCIVHSKNEHKPLDINYNLPPDALEYLHNRGLTDETIKRFNLGYTKYYGHDAIAIPVGGFHKIRKYKLHKKNERWARYPKGEKSTLFGNTTDQYLILCAGEWDYFMLVQNGLENAITGTAGEHTFKSEWVGAFKDKSVSIIFDLDDAGKIAAEAAAKKLAAIAKEIKIITLPEELGEKGDLTDYFQKGHTADDLWRLIAETESLNLDNMREEVLEEQKAKYSKDDPYFYNGGLLWRYKSTQEGKVPVPIANFRAEATKEIIQDNGLEESRNFFITGECDGRPLKPIEVPSNRFSGMNWVNESWGLKVTVFPPSTNKEYVRHSIHEFSKNAEVERVFTHTGWRKVGGEWIYLSASGAIGAENVSVCLPRELQKYALPTEIDSQLSMEGIKASLSFLELAPMKITLPIYSFLFLSPLTTIIKPHPNFSTYLFGETGSFKTTLSCLALCHYGNFKGHDGLSNFHDTANALEKRAFILKDKPMILDDFHPSYSSRDASQKEGIAQRMIREYSNRTGRARLNADATEKGRYEPRGMLLLTGEDLPQGSSTGARLWGVEVDRSQVDVEKLSALQEKSDLLPYAMASYINWLRGNLDAIGDRFTGEFYGIRDNITANCSHPKIKEQIAFLFWGYGLVLEWLTHEGIIDEETAKQRAKEAWNVLLDSIKEQENRVEKEDPVKQFFEIFAALKSQGKVKVSNKTSLYDASGSNGDFVGYEDDDFYYLLSKNLWHAVKTYCRTEGSFFSLGERAVTGILKKRGFLETEAGRTTKLEWINSKPVRVLKLNKSMIDKVIQVVE